MTPGDKSKPPKGGDDSLLDPEAFWDSESTAEPAQTPDPLPDQEDTGTDSEVAVVTSVPTSAPDELFLPKKDRETKAPPKKSIRPAPPRRTPRPELEFKTSPPRIPRGRLAWIVAGLIAVVGLGGWLGWRLLGDRTQSDETRQPIPKATGFEAAGVRSTAPETGTEPKAQPQPDPPEVKLSELKMGTLRLTSDPPGAVVFLNDQKSGATPTTIKDIESGATVDIRIEAEGFKAWSHSVVFDGKDLKREFHAGLLEEDDCPAGTGWVYVTTEPPGATVELDEKRLPGKTPMVINTVCAGEQHRVRVQARGFRTWWHSFRLTAGEVVNLKADLKK